MTISHLFSEIPADTAFPTCIHAPVFKIYGKRRYGEAFLRLDFSPYREKIAIIEGTINIFRAFWKMWRIVSHDILAPYVQSFFSDFFPGKCGKGEGGKFHFFTMTARSQMVLFPPLFFPSWSMDWNEIPYLAPHPTSHLLPFPLQHVWKLSIFPPFLFSPPSLTLLSLPTDTPRSKNHFLKYCLRRQRGRETGGRHSSLSPFALYSPLLCRSGEKSLCFFPPVEKVCDGKGNSQFSDLKWNRKLPLP